MTFNLESAAIHDEKWSAESDILQLSESCAHLAGLPGGRASIDKHNPSQSLLRWAMGAGGRVKAFPAEGDARPFWTVEIKIHGVEVSLYSWEEL